MELYNSGYITSPNYPDKYYMDAECRWSVHVQRRQAIRITLLDFELDVKRGGRCHDYLQIASGDRTFFRDCGALGRQIVDVDTSCSHVTVTFRTGQTSLTQRGFLLHFEGSPARRSYFAPSAWYCNRRVCVSVCQLAYIKNRTSECRQIFCSY